MSIIITPLKVVSELHGSYNSIDDVDVQIDHRSVKPVDFLCLKVIDPAFKHLCMQHKCDALVCVPSGYQTMDRHEYLAIQDGLWESLSVFIGNSLSFPLTSHALWVLEAVKSGKSLIIDNTNCVGIADLFRTAVFNSSPRTYEHYSIAQEVWRLISSAASSGCIINITTEKD